MASEGATVRPTAKQSNAVRSPNATPPSIAAKRIASSRTDLPSIQPSKSTSANNATLATPSPPIRSPTKLKTLSVTGSVRTARLTSPPTQPLMKAIQLEDSASPACSPHTHITSITAAPSQNPHRPLPFYPRPQLPHPSPSPKANGKPLLSITPQSIPPKASKSIHVTPSKPKGVTARSTHGRKPCFAGSRGKVLSGGTIGSGTAVATDDKHPFWDGDDMTMEMVTDLDDWNVDEMETALSSIMAVHIHKILPYKCLLERAQA
ncbi:hypothetical protein K443DRAFT_6374 [Laccaria amethystina LaAM-08-1]|uniref:Unplaced genomic scaffold K443scaffold_227, whole genome shotgun sequence n=1 Tax=Laccaria amethystina LaAM-08-1 TaxID=1095629 RepID=A0A0C9XWS4_9AGAR|nr:hypothetical protein K443DRAFT_11498 [Laccaria amethystina LaAM-08-1]KIK02077.1 hypothetical protein K443DRAFT_6374 [Laccaria amethystina LaAM-08-1]